MRLGDLDALKEDLTKWFPQFTLEGIEAKTLFNQILHDIDNAPTVEPFAEVHFETFREYERPHGDWITDDNRNVVCSYCGGIRRDCRIDHIAFCNRCGADMKGGAE